MKTTINILLVLAFVYTTPLAAQPLPFKDNNRWGIKQNDTILVAPAYDTIFNFDALGKVCMACYKIKATSSNKFIKAITTTYNCRYLDKRNKRLVIKIDKDTCSVFQIGKNTLKLYNTGETFFTVTAKNKKYLVTKDFKQLTLQGYHDICLSDDPNFYVTQYKNEGDIVLTGLVNLREEQVIPYIYSNVKVNPKDSLIVACSAGVRASNSEDDIYNYKGKKLDSYWRHVDMATKHYVIYKLFQPKEYFIIYNTDTKEEKQLNADELLPAGNDELLIRTKNDWYLYNMGTGQKKPYKHS